MEGIQGEPILAFKHKLQFDVLGRSLIAGSVLITDTKDRMNTLDPVCRLDGHGRSFIESNLRLVDQHENPKKNYIAAGPAILLNRPRIHDDCSVANYRFEGSNQGIAELLAVERLIHHYLYQLWSR